MSLWLGYPDSHAMSRFHAPLFHCLNGLLVTALDLFQDPFGPHAEKHRHLVALVTMRLQAREKRSDLVDEVLRIVNVLQRYALTGDLGGQRASLRPLAPSPRAPWLTFFPLARTDLPPFDYGPLSHSTVFTRPLPLPLTADPFRPFARAARAGGPDDGNELAPLWDALARGFGAVYAAPDRREWDELVRAQAGGGKPWEAGVDVLA